MLTTSDQCSTDSLVKHCPAGRKLSRGGGGVRFKWGFTKIGSYCADLCPNTLCRKLIKYPPPPFQHTCREGVRDAARAERFLLVVSGVLYSRSAYCCHKLALTGNGLITPHHMYIYDHPFVSYVHRMLLLMYSRIENRLFLDIFLICIHSETKSYCVNHNWIIPHKNCRFQ